MTSRTLWMTGAATALCLIATGAQAQAQAQGSAQTPAAARLQAQIDALRAQVSALSAQLGQGAVVTNVVDAQAPTGSGPPGAAGEGPVGGAAGTQAAPLAEPRTVFAGAPRTTDSSGDSFKVRGRILVDAVNEDVSRDNDRFAGQTQASDYHARNLRGRQIQLGVEGQIGEHFAYKMEGGFVNGGSPQWAYAGLEWKFSKKDSLIFGNVKTAGLENITSQKFTTFIDRGPYQDLTDTSFILSAQLVHVDTNYSLWAAVQGASVNSSDVTAGAYGSSSANERIGVTARATYLPVSTRTQKLHLGVWGRYRNRGGESGFGYTAWPNTNYHSETPTASSLLTTGTVGGSDFTVAGEFAWVMRNLSFQAEAADIMVDRLDTGRNAVTGGGDFDIRTAYAFVSWFPTGEMRSYAATGQFGRVKVLNPIDRGGAGAFELAARMDYDDLSDLKANDVTDLAKQTPLFTSGRYMAGTVGLNWYPISYVRFMGNYTHGEIINRRVGPVQNDASVDVFQLRSQIDF